MSETAETVQPIRPHSYPLWVIALALLVVAATAYSSLSIPRYYTATREAADGARALATGHIETAERLDREALAISPTSKKVRLSLARALFSDRDVSNDEEALNLLTGITIDESEWRELSNAMPAEYQTLFTRTQEH